MRVLSLIFLLLVSILALAVGASGVWAGVFTSLGVGTFLLVLEELFRGPWPLQYWVLAIRRWNRLVRVSISHLYRIQIDGKYLLIRSDRFPDNFQPVGGVTKRYSTAMSEMARLEVRDDNVVPIDATSESDLRVRVKGKNLLPFLRWYRSGVDRETSGWREIYEELIASGHLPPEHFPHVQERWVRTHLSKPRWSDWAASDEVFVAEIWDILPTEDQIRSLRDLQISCPDELLWATSEQIERRGLGMDSAKVQISEHTQWIL